jgi:hypothetical protein
MSIRKERIRAKRSVRSIINISSFTEIHPEIAP